MNEIIKTIGTLITSPYPYFAILGYFGLKSYTVIIEKPPSIYFLTFFILIIGFLSFLCVLVYVLIQKVGHVEMLPPQFQIERERLRFYLNKEELKRQIKEGIVPESGDGTA
ncbi:MAG: hypothetical protein FJ134_12110 [Deltaproteobacteria bacterium]|nr:hypothetical protein [Deltaproteobacteria bacterium]